MVKIFCNFFKLTSKCQIAEIKKRFLKELRPAIQLIIFSGHTPLAGLHELAKGLGST
jgi:hypothetical protein